MRQEFSITLPLLCNEGKPLKATHKDLSQRLCAHFGGLSAFNVEGMWADPNDGGLLYVEEGKRYVVAGTGNDIGDYHVLLSLARLVCELADQKCVYITSPVRGVEFVNPVYVSQTAAA